MSLNKAAQADRMYRAIELLHTNLKESRAWALSAFTKGGTDGSSFVRDFCTITVGGPRQTGHTSAALTYACHVAGRDVLYVAPYRDQARLAYSKNSHFKSETFKAVSEVTEEDVAAANFIVVDSASDVQPDDLDSLYRYLAKKDKSNLCVLLVG